MTNHFIPAPTPDPASHGTTVTICYDDIARAGQTITVTISNGGGKALQKGIVLGADGKGCTTWVVPDDWASFAATMTEPGSDDYALAIDP